MHTKPAIKISKKPGITVTTDIKAGNTLGQFSALTIDQIKNLNQNQIRALTSGQIKTLTQSQIKALTGIR